MNFNNNSTNWFGKSKKKKICNEHKIASAKPLNATKNFLHNNQQEINDIFMQIFSHAKKNNF
jgi:hypothetical protein